MNNEAGGDAVRPVHMGVVIDLMNALTTRAFCATLLRHANAWLPIDHCALMRMAPGAAIQLFDAQALKAFESRGARAIVRYIDRYHRDDPIRRVLDAPGAPAAIVMRRERAVELAPSEYRDACFAEPGIVDRISFARRDGRGGWVMLDLRRQAASGEFSERETRLLSAMAPLLLAACARHIELLLHASADPAAWRLRLANACPSMSGRELDVAAHLLAGRTLREAAGALGVTYSSVVTYCERAYARLGVANLRDLRSRFTAQRAAAPAPAALHPFAA